MATRNTRQYTDFNLLFSSHPVTGDVTRKNDEEAVKQSRRSLISTRHYERPFHPEIGCQIHGLLFENFNPVTVQVMKKTILDTIDKFEPRVTVLEVKLREKADDNEVVCDVIFRLNNSDRPITLTTLLTRIR
jgi:phage baseplate assembly protein W